MNSKALKVLEYNKIIEQLASYATSPLGNKKCLELLPSTDISEINSSQIETADALSRVYSKGSISFSGAKDISATLMGLEVGQILGIGELLSISAVLSTCARVKSYSKSDNDEENRDSLDVRFDAIEPVVSLNNEILRCILSEDTISDDATPELKNIRRLIKTTNDKIHDHLTSMINSQASKSMLQDNLITMRNGRYCVPVKSEYKGQVTGMVHDQSASGSTYFIEPMAVVKYNNQLAELAVSEANEIERILAYLSSLASDYTDVIKADISILAELDFIFAKAMLAKHMKATAPLYNTEHVIDIKKGRHPLIDSKHVVPIDIYLGTKFNQLIITGPNTGGKTVSLKTVGLFTLMGQAGLHIPAFDGSMLSVFNDVFADIGDEQSIEQNLSTFSSHMTNNISILEHADENSLVLFDELGAGTDPTEGAALAMSILSFLHNCQVTTMATTHYSEIKLFALETEGIENACCEFDVATLKPTYRLLIGIPGKSNAFAISGRLGLPEHIIETARGYLSSSDKKFEDVIADLEASKVACDNERNELQKKLEDADTIMKEYLQKKEKFDNNKERILSEANEEARTLLREAKDYADDTIKKYNKWFSGQDSIKAMEKERQTLNSKLKVVDSKLPKSKAPSPKKTHSASELKLGDSIRVLSMGLNGTITALPNAKGEVGVQMGIFNSKVSLRDIELIDEEVITGPVLSKTGSGSIKMSKASSIRPDINVIGKTVDDALAAVDKYLDDAYLSHLTQVTIIHGRGTGALRNAIASYLKKSKYVKSYRSGVAGEGDQGVTIVEFK